MGPDRSQPDRSGEARLRMPPLDAERLLETLVERGVEFVIIGGYALSAHGVVRATKDVDIVPDPSEANLGKLADAIAALDGEVALADDFDAGELGLAPDLEGLRLGGNWALRTRHGRLDVMQDVPGLTGYDALRAAAVTRGLGKLDGLLFCGLDDLIAMKTLAGRPQDQIDVTSLERARRA